MTTKVYCVLSLKASLAFVATRFIVNLLSKAKRQDLTIGCSYSQKFFACANYFREPCVSFDFKSHFKGSLDKGSCHESDWGVTIKTNTLSSHTDATFCCRLTKITVTMADCNTLMLPCYKLLYKSINWCKVSITTINITNVTGSL